LRYVSQEDLKENVRRTLECCGLANQSE